MLKTCLKNAVDELKNYSNQMKNSPIKLLS